MKNTTAMTTAARIIASLSNADSSHSSERGFSVRWEHTELSVTLHDNDDGLAVVRWGPDEDGDCSETRDIEASLTGILDAVAADMA